MQSARSESSEFQQTRPRASCFAGLSGSVHRFCEPYLREVYQCYSLTRNAFNVYTVENTQNLLAKRFPKESLHRSATVSVITANLIPAIGIKI